MSLDKTPAPAPKKPSSKAAELAAAVSGSNLFAQPAPSTPPAAGVAAIVPYANSNFTSTIRLTLDDVDPYERNPRTLRNAKFFEIKESIRARGLDTMIWVTKRPGSKRHVQAKGGGTRYAALRELWEETGDRRFYELDFTYCEYKSELELLVAHMSENLNRDDMCFWDKALGYVRLKQDIEDAYGELTYDQTIAKFKEHGLPEISRSLLALYQFAVDHLTALGKGTFSLTMKIVRDDIQPGYNLYQRLIKLAPADIQFDEGVWKPVLSKFDKENIELDWGDIAQGVNEALMVVLSLDADALKTALQAVQFAQRNAALQDLTWAQLFPAPAGNDDGGEGEGNDAGQQSDAPPAPPVRVNKSPGTYTPRIEPEDGDRPPADLVAQVEAEQKSRANQADENNAGTVQKPAQAPTLSSPNAAGLKPQGAGTELRSSEDFDVKRRTLFGYAMQLAATSKTLEGQIVRRENLPMGWMIDLPADVLAGTPLAPLAKQIFWFLAHVSFQIHAGVRQADGIAGTRFGQFMHTAPTDDQWAFVRPDSGFDFLMEWFIDPANIAVISTVMQMLTLVRELIANYPEHFLDLSPILKFEDLQADHQAARKAREQAELDYFIDNGATPAMVKQLFSAAAASTVRFTPGRVAEIDLKTTQRLWPAWEAICRETASDRQRFLRLHEQFSEISIASLWSAIYDFV